MEEWKDIIVADSLGIVKTDIEEQYLSHLLCLGVHAVSSLTGKSSSCVKATSALSDVVHWWKKYARLPTSGAKSFTPNLASSS